MYLYIECGDVMALYAVVFRMQIDSFISLRVICGFVGTVKPGVVKLSNEACFSAVLDTLDVARGCSYYFTSQQSL